MHTIYIPQIATNFDQLKFALSLIYYNFSITQKLSQRFIN